MKLTVIFGYSIFAILVIGLINTTIIPLLSTAPGATGIERRISVTIALALSAILPPIVAYIAGDISHRKASRLQRHYNGVLFAVLGTWIALAVSQFAHSLIPMPDVNIHFAIWLQFWPSLIATPLIVIVLAFFYHKKKSSPFGPLAFAPYQILITTSVVIFIAMQLWTILQMPVERTWSQWEITSFIASLATIAMAIVSYIVTKPLHKASKGRVSLVAVIASMGIFAITTLYTLGYFESLWSSILVTLLGIGAWALYVFLQRKK